MKPVEIDETDGRIANLLMDDGRISSAEIARRVGGVTERTVRYRIERMISQGVIRISAISNPQVLGYPVVADVLIEVEPGRILQVAQRLAEHECVSYVACSTGQSDVSIQVVAHDNAELYDFVTQVIGHVPGVRKTTTILVPIIVKDVYQWRIPTSAFRGSTPASSRSRGGAVSKPFQFPGTKRKQVRNRAAAR
jgi:Lrp/AsnC family transcriptional regulator for asnA, asnC and gidA